MTQSSNSCCTGQYLDVLGELRVVLVGVLLLEVAHVLGDVTAKDALTVDAGVVLTALVVAGALGVGTREATSVVRNVEAAVDGTLHVHTIISRKSIY